jgi:hypothetical protein
MLKTIVNVMFDRELTPEQKWRPPDWWVRCVFGEGAFPAFCGLYLLEGESQWRLTEEAAIGIRPLTKNADSDELVGGQFRLAELQFALTMQPLHETHLHLYRLRALKDKPSLQLRQIIHFRWASVSSG